MTKRANNVSIEERDGLIMWAATAANCWLILSAGAVLAGVAHLIRLV